MISLADDMGSGNSIDSCPMRRKLTQLNISGAFQTLGADKLSAYRLQAGLTRCFN